MVNIVYMIVKPSCPGSVLNNNQVPTQSNYVGTDKKHESVVQTCMYMYTYMQSCRIATLRI